MIFTLFFNNFLYLPQWVHSLQKIVLKVLTMTDDKTKQKAIEAAADIYGE